MMLKGGGTVEPVSKYDIHNLVRENFHSVSDFWEMSYEENVRITVELTIIHLYIT